MRPVRKVRKTPVGFGDVELRTYVSGRLVEVRTRRAPNSAPHIPVYRSVGKANNRGADRMRSNRPWA